MDTNSRDINLEKRIDAYIKGDLSREEVEQLWVELLKKPEYIDLLETEIEVARYYRSENEEVLPAFSYWKWGAAAAAAIGLLLVVGLYFIDGPSTSEPAQAGGAVPSIVLSDHLASAYVTRSPGDIPSGDSLLNAGFMAALDGETERAMDIYHSILTQYNDSSLRAKAHLNAGILQYNAGDYGRSVGSFTEAVRLAPGDALLKERSYWFMGNALFQVNQLEKARETLQKIHGRGQIFQEQAGELLRELDRRMAGDTQ